MARRGQPSTHAADVAVAPPQPPAELAQQEEPAYVYRGVVSHKRWRPTSHGFAYELFMVMVDVDVSRLRRVCGLAVDAGDRRSP